MPESRSEGHTDHAQVERAHSHGAAHEDLRAEVSDLRRRLSESEARFHGIVERSSDGILVVDDRGRVLFANSAAAAMLRRPEGDLVGSEIGFPLTAGDVTEVELIRPGRDVMYAELRVVDSEWRGEHCRLAIARDVTARHDAEVQLAHRATHDALTGLPNRYLLQDRLTQAIARLAREHGSVTFLLADLDDFKAVNDRYGHLTGDLVLIEAARRIRAVLRPADTAARYGGDEFALVCETMDHDEATALVARLEAAFAPPMLVAGRTLDVGISIGFSVVDTTRPSIERVVENADRAMYERKERRSSTETSHS